MVNKIYNVGDKVWEADCGTKEIKYPCPVCYGKKEVSLITSSKIIWDITTKAP